MFLEWHRNRWMSLNSVYTLPRTCDNHQQRQAMKLVDWQSGERCPALHAEDKIAEKEKEEATLMR
jgi:hypothetical protein